MNNKENNNQQNNTKMKIMYALLAATVIMMRPSVQADTNSIKGNLAISYVSRVTAGKPDVYNMDVRICDSARIHGAITNFWQDQKNMLVYSLPCDVINPANLAQTMTIGRLIGRVPVGIDGIYDFSGLRILSDATGFESKFGGTAAGRPLQKKKVGWFDSIKASAAKEVLKLTKSVNGQTVSLNVTNYDRMLFTQHVLAAGPINDLMYPSVTVNGEMLYDYDRFVWHFRGLSVVYSYEGKMLADRLTGNIQWIEDAKARKQTGEAYYKFDVKVNEPPPNESSSFSGKPMSEASYFQVDTTVPSLVGTMKYKDSFSNGGTVVASSVAIDLSGNKLNKQQCMNLFKLVIISCIVPVNAE